MKLMDLHIHTDYSDGDLSPSQIIEEVRKNNINTFSITDHDTLKGVQEIYNQIPYDLTFIPGVELSSKISGGRLHILGYNIDPFNKELNDKLNEFHHLSRVRLKIIYDYLNKNYNISFTNEELNEIYNRRGNVGRPELAKLLVKYKHADYIQDAFDKYLIKAGNETNHLVTYLSPKEAIDLIIKAGGMAIIAHPISLNKSDK